MSEQCWGWSPFTDSAGATEFLSWSTADIELETDVAVRRLKALDFGTGDIVLVVAALTEAAYFAPIQRAARRLGGISCTAEASPYDAYRTAAYLKQFPLRATIGLDASVVGALGAFGDVGELLGRCPWHVVRPDAVPAVREVGVDPLTLRFVGPALAMECPSRNGVHLGGRDTWTVSRSSDAFALSPAPGRDLALRPVHLPQVTGIETATCGCGSDDPRLRLSADLLEVETKGSDHGNS